MLMSVCVCVCVCVWLYIIDDTGLNGCALARVLVRGFGEDKGSSLSLPFHPGTRPRIRCVRERVTAQHKRGPLHSVAHTALQ